MSAETRKMVPPTPPTKLTGADYEWFRDGARWYCYSSLYCDDGASMYYWARRRKGRFVVTFEGGRVGPARGYASLDTASRALAVMENRGRNEVYQERVKKWSERRTRRQLRRPASRATATE